MRERAQNDSRAWGRTDADEILLLFSGLIPWYSFQDNSYTLGNPVAKRTLTTRMSDLTSTIEEEEEGIHRLVPEYSLPSSSVTRLGTAKLLLIIGFSGLGTFAYLSSQFNGGGVHSTTKQLQLAKDGIMGYYLLSTHEQKVLFGEFQHTYEKTYDMDEESTRFQHFQSFLKKIDENNRLEKKTGGTAVHGLTIFADYSENEFSSRFLTYQPTVGASSSVKGQVEKYTGSKTSVDWTDKYTTAIKDQGMHCSLEYIHLQPYF